MMNIDWNYLTGPQLYIPLTVAVATYLVLWAVKNILIVKLRRISAATETLLDDIVLNILEKTGHFFILIFSLYLGLQAARIDNAYMLYINRIFLVVLGFQVIAWGKEAIESWTNMTMAKKADDAALRTSMGFVSILVKMVFIILVVLFVLNNLGVNVSTFIAGLGVGGIAIALATQNILGDLFSSLSIVLDKPFIVGDFISLGDWLGTIEKVGLKTTRLRSLTGEQIVISNSDLLSSRIRNFKRMQERRVVFQLGVTYQTKREHLQKGPEIIKQIINAEEMARFDRAHFFRYGASSLDFEVVYWVLKADYNSYADVHQRILFAIHEAFEQNGLSFAYPTQTLFIEKTASPLMS
jgi:small-conductance mechanosensitive channel